MKKQYLKYIILILVFLLCMIPNKSLAITSSGGYTIENYYIEMVVNENNTFNVTEEITTYFSSPKHGIFRKIPLANSVTRTDGTKSNNRAQITNITVNEEYSTSIENGYKVIKIGSSSQTWTGRHSYTIKYTYNIGKDPLKNVDELYYNLIGNEWDTTIRNLTFKIVMPKTFDETLLGFSSGYAGSTNSSNVSYNVDGNIISGSIKNSLEAGEGLTVRLTLPEGYFVGTSFNIDMCSVTVIAVSICFVFIAFLLWSKYGKDDKIVETIEFYPPEGLNSAETGYIYEGYASDKSVISLLIYLANKGYLKIEQIESKNVFKETKKIKFIKLKEYDGNNENERIFLEELFNNGKESVMISELRNNFYKTLTKIENNMNSKKNHEKIFDSKSKKFTSKFIYMIGFIYALITIRPIIEVWGTLSLVLIPVFIVCSIMGFAFLFLMLFAKGPILPRIIVAIFLEATIGFRIALQIILQIVLDNSIYLTSYIVGMIAIIFLIIFMKIMPKRTQYGNELLGKVKGFKRFLETAEKSQLESLVEQNPEYFYNILPYTYALGVSKVWMEQFEEIALKAPDWYDSSDAFNMYDFSTFMTATMATTASAMSSSPSSSDGGSSSDSGGGSSGGGSGGGGGGSW